MSGHTPGPWKFVKDANFIMASIVICENIAPTHPRTGNPEWTPQHEANARLIAAAPDLLQALQTIALHAPSLDAEGIRALCDEAIAKAVV